MKTPTTQHTDVLLRCEHLLKNALRSAGAPRFRRALQRDCRIVSEIREMLYYAIENPALPFPVPQDPLPSPYLAALDAELEAELVSETAKPKPILNQIEDEPNGSF